MWLLFILLRRYGVCYNGLIDFLEGLENEKVVCCIYEYCDLVFLLLRMR